MRLTSRLVKTLVVACGVGASFLGTSAHAYYAEATPPPNWVSSSSTSERALFRAAQSESWNVARSALTHASFNAGGKPVIMNAAMRAAAGVPARSMVGFIFGPVGAVATLAIPLLYDYWREGGFNRDPVTGVWSKTVSGETCEGSCYWKSLRTDNKSGSEAGVCTADASTFYGHIKGYGVLVGSVCEMRVPDTSAKGYYVADTSGASRIGTPTQTAKAVPATQQEMLDFTVVKPPTIEVMNELDHSPATVSEWKGWEVQDPILNPAPDIKADPAPGTLTVPTGLPYPIPNTDPVKYQQPTLQIKPAPSPQLPWRVDASPINKPVATEAGITETQVITPNGQPQPKPASEAAAITCGRPSTTACKIDESGTVASPVNIDPKNTVDEAIAPLKDLVTSPASKLPALPKLNWNFSLPSGCTVIAIAAFAPFLQSIDVCQFQPMMHQLMSMVWVLGALFGAISMFWRGTFAAA